MTMHFLRLTGFFLLTFFSQLQAWAQFNTTFLGHLDYTQTVNDVWGYAANNREYALVGTRTGTGIVEVTNPTNPTELFFVPGPISLWRDMKVWQHYAYVTNETDTGLHIFDLQNLPASIDTWNWTGGLFQGINIPIHSAHNIFIDENGIGYIFGSNFGIGGVVMIDIAANPVNPPIVGIYNEAYVHDGYARGDTLWTAEIYAGQFSVIDITDKANPIVMASQTTPSNFAHNCWLSNDGHTLITTDEKSAAFVTAYDVSDITDIKELDRYQSNPGSGVIPHNTFFYNNFIVTSYYRDGATIVDATYPNSLIPVGHYDTSPLFGNNYNGCWGVYPYLPSGILLASDMEEGLFVIQPSYTPACYLQGLVTDALTGNPLLGAQISIADTAYTQTQTAFNGSFTTGIATSGTYPITVSLFGYETQTAEITLQNGVVTSFNIALQPLASFSLNLLLTDAATGAPLPNATVQLQSPAGTQTLTTNPEGQITAPLYAPETYHIYAGKWGYRTLHLTPFITPETANLTLPLTRGYYDDFFFDYGWQVSGNATSGVWVRDVPIGTTFASQPSNVAADVDSDFGNQCFITGNSGTGLADNVSEGTTILASPIFDLSGYQNPELSYYRYLSLQNGSNDTLKIQISNGLETQTIEAVTDGNPYEYLFHQTTIDIADLLQPTATMQLFVTISDMPGSGHVVEAAFDVFEITEGISPQAAFTTAGGITSGCSEIGVQFIANATAGSLIQWVFPGGTPEESTDAAPWVTYSTPGTYPVVLVAANVYGTDELNVADYISVYAQPAVNVSTASTVCLGSNLTLTAISSNELSTYFWQGNGLLNTNADMVQATPDTAGSTTYTISVTDVNGCTAENTADVLILETPVYTITADANIICTEQTITLTANGPNTYTYTWLGADEFTPLQANAQSVSVVAPQDAGTLTFTASAFDTATGCAAPPQNEAVQVAVSNPIEGIFAPTQACLGQEIELSVVNQGEPADGFIWQQNGIVLPYTTPSITALFTEDVTFSVQVSTSACTDTEMVTVTAFPPAPAVILYAQGEVNGVLTDNEVCAGSPLLLGGAVLSGVAPFTYFWQGLGITDPTASNALAIVTDTSGLISYTGIITDANGCQNTQSISIMVLSDEECMVGINNNQANPLLTLLPNPALNGSFTIQATLPVNEQPVLIEVFNATGQLVWHETVLQQSNPFNHNIQMPNYIPGLYWVRINHNGVPYIAKLMCR